MEETKQIRKLQLSGGSTFVISLPKNWIEDLKLTVGDNITIVKNPDNSILLFPDSDGRLEELDTATISLGQNDAEEIVKRRIIAIYLAGFKTIKVKTKGVKIQAGLVRLIRNFVRTSMIGTEIVESSSEALTIQILTRLPELSFVTAIKRMQLMATNMHREAIEALESADVVHSEDIVQMDNEVDRFSLYTRRNLMLAIQNAGILKEMGLKKPSDCLGHRAVISRIERIADHAVLIAKRVKFVDEKIDPKLMKRIKELSEGSLEVFEQAIVALLDNDFMKAEKVSAKINNIIEDEKEFMSSLRDSTKNSTVIRFVLEDIRRTAEYSSDIAEVAIDENISSVISEKI